VYILDTSVIIELIRRNPAFLNRFRRIAGLTIGIFTITLVYYEVQRGIVYLNATAQKRRLTDLLQRVTMQGVDDPQILDTAADIHSELRRHGRTFSDIDIFVMAAASVRGLTVITTDPDFMQAAMFIPNLNVEQW
jgi:predicted nucleic acid-binding protein